MVRLFFAFLILICVKGYSQNCSALYSYGANFTNVHFFNQSVLSNAHYYWNFGDGTSSNAKDPIHDYQENGTYLVTLYVNDTINNCSNYYEQWLSITKLSADPCSPQLSADSIYLFNGLTLIKFANTSTNCNNYIPRISTLGSNGAGGYFDTYILPEIPGNFITTLRYYDNNYQFERAATKTLPWLYDRSKNYQDCSANFEFSVISEDTNGQTFLFSAMNKHAASYQWYITGFGDPIIRTGDTAIFTYAGDIYAQEVPLPNMMYLRTVGQNGCVDSLWQSFIVRKKSSTYVGINSLSEPEQGVKIYPNPTAGSLTIQQESAARPIKEVRITNLVGQEVYKAALQHPTQILNLGFLQPGVYFLTVDSPGHNSTYKLIKE